MTQHAPNPDTSWANPGALGLAAFGLNLLLLQIHTLGWIESAMPTIFGLFWGGVAQFFAGRIEGNRGDTFGLTAVWSFSVFWIGLSMATLMQWPGVAVIDKAGLGWTFIIWTIFNLILTVAAFKMSLVHIFLFSSVNVLLILTAAHNFWGLPAVVPGIVGLVPSFLATYAAAAVILNSRYGRTVVPMGTIK